VAKQAEQMARKSGQYHHGDLRHELLRIARDEIARNGADSVSLSSLARLAGVSQPAPYRHFADRDALLEGVAEKGFEEFDKVLTEAGTGRTPQEALRAMALAYVNYGEVNIELYRLMFASRLVPQAKHKSALAKAADKAFDQLRRVMVEISPPEIVEQDALLAWAQLHGLVMLRADGFVNHSLSQFLDSPNLLKTAKHFICVD
jgi:AcrR family transcriptional regulator